MFEITIFDQVNMERRVVHTIPDCDEGLAALKTQEFLFANGHKLADLQKRGSDRRITVYGYEDQESVATDIGGHCFVANSVFFTFKYIYDELGINVDSFIDL